jgi:hypothetical protein
MCQLLPLLRGRTPDTGALPGERAPRARWRRARSRTRTSRGRRRGRSHSTGHWGTSRLVLYEGGDLSAPRHYSQLPELRLEHRESVLAASISHELALRMYGHSNCAGTMPQKSCTHAATRVCGDGWTAATCGHLGEAAAAEG